MFRVTLTGRRQPSGEVPSVEVEVPVLPPIGSHVAHDASGLSGSVHHVGFWWGEEGNQLEIEVELR